MPEHRDRHTAIAAAASRLSCGSVQASVGRLSCREHAAGVGSVVVTLTTRVG